MRYSDYEDDEPDEREAVAGFLASLIASAIGFCERNGEILAWVFFPLACLSFFAGFVMLAAMLEPGP